MHRRKTQEAENHTAACNEWLAAESCCCGFKKQSKTNKKEKPHAENKIE